MLAALMLHTLLRDSDADYAVTDPMPLLMPFAPSFRWRYRYATLFATPPRRLMIYAAAADMAAKCGKMLRAYSLTPPRRCCHDLCHFSCLDGTMSCRLRCH